MSVTRRMRALRDADMRDPDITDQHLSGDHTIDAVTRRTPLQQQICTAVVIDTNDWNHAQPR